MADTFWQQTKDSLRDFLTQYPVWTAIDQFLDSKWGKRFLATIGGAIVTAAGSIIAFVVRLSPYWKGGALGATLALAFIAAVEILLYRRDKPLEEISFDYFPASPLEHGWKIAYTDGRIAKNGQKAIDDYWNTRQWKIATDFPTKNSGIVDIDGGAIEYESTREKIPQ